MPLVRLGGPGAPLLALAALAGCVPDNHPLGQQGNVEIFFDSGRPIFAADVLDENGVPVLPRQSPSEKRVELFLTSASKPDSGAYVDVQVDPPGSVVLVPDTDAEPTCETIEGAFRCTAAEDGFARFIARSDSDWSGIAKIGIAERTEGQDLEVKPAGLPQGSSNFELIIVDVEGDKVRAKYNALECTLSPSPDDTFKKWPEGKTRVREAEVRASAPLTTPGVLEHAPVIIETLHPEVFVTMDETCQPPRDSRMRLQLDALGKSPRFYFCFSDVGGSDVKLAFRSGELEGEARVLVVEPEPRLLRVVTEVQNIEQGTGSQAVVSLSAFDADLQKIPLTVDVKSDHPERLAIEPPANLTLPTDERASALVLATPGEIGPARIIVTPELFDEPACESAVINIIDPSL